MEKQNKVFKSHHIDLVQIIYFIALHSRMSLGYLHLNVKLPHTTIPMEQSKCIVENNLTNVKESCSFSYQTIYFSGCSIVVINS